MGYLKPSKFIHLRAVDADTVTVSSLTVYSLDFSVHHAANAGAFKLRLPFSFLLAMMYSRAANWKAWSERRLSRTTIVARMSRSKYCPLDSYQDRDMLTILRCPRSMPWLHMVRDACFASSWRPRPSSARTRLR